MLHNLKMNNITLNMLNGLKTKNVVLETIGQWVSEWWFNAVSETEAIFTAKIEQGIL